MDNFYSSTVTSRGVEERDVTLAWHGDRTTILALLNAALADELVCVLRYKRHYHVAAGIDADPVKAEFLEHANEERAHADLLLERMRQLGGTPDLDPSLLLFRSHTEHREGADLEAMIQEDLAAKRSAIESYGDMIALVDEKDPRTRCLLHWILAQEREHADALEGLLKSFSRDEARG